MSEYLTTETEISELSEACDDYIEILNRNNNLQLELEMLRKEDKDKEFELGNTIAILKFENENLKQTIKSYNELIDYYKSNNDKNSRSNSIELTSNNTSSDVIKSNLEYITKISELENKNFNSEQNEHNLRREIFILNSTVNNLKFELEKMSNSCNDYERRESVDGDHSLINENDINELLQEIDDLKKEKAEISERALNILAEKELSKLELLSEFEELKSNHESEILELRKKSESREKRQLSAIDLPNIVNFSYPNEKELLNKYHQLDEDYLQIKKELSDKENLWDHERERLTKSNLSLESSHRSNMNEFENEISKLKNEIFNLEMEKGTLEKELITDKSSIENEIEHYTIIIKSLENQKEKTESNSQTQINNIKKELRDNDLTNTILREQNFNLEKQIVDLKNEHIRKIESIQDKWKYDSNIKETEIQKLKLKNDILEKEKDSLKREFENNKKNNEMTKNDFKDLLEQCKKIKEMNEEEKKKGEEKLFNAENTFDSERIFLKNQIKDLMIVIDEKGLSDVYELSEKKPHHQNNINLMDYNSEENPTLLKNKVKLLQSDIQKLNSLIKLKDNKNSNIFRLNGEVDILKKEKSKLINEICEMKEMYEIQIRDLLFKVNLNQVAKFESNRGSGVKPNNFSSKQIVENLELEGKIESLNRENKFLNDQLENLKKEVDNVKILKDNHIHKLKEDIEEALRSAVHAKISLAQGTFEKDCEVLKYKNLCKKLKLKNSFKTNYKETTMISGNVVNGSNYQTNTSDSTVPIKRASFFEKMFK